MAMKKFINKAEELVPELIDGFVKANPQIVKQSAERIVSRVDPKEAGKVGIVTMGGAGHEPALIGWVGRGLVDVVALGDIFAAPGAPRVVEALKQADYGAGVVLVVFNHEGDVLSSNMVIQMAGRQGLKMKRILSSDDISNAPRNDQDNRRGLIGTLMVLKVVGAAAEAGYSSKKSCAWARRCRSAPPRLQSQPRLQRTLPPVILSSTCPMMKWKSAWASTAKLALGG